VRIVLDQTSKSDSHQSDQISLRKIFRLGWGIIPLLACIAGYLICVNPILFGIQNEIATVDFGDGYHIRLWDEMDGLTDPSWDPDHAYPAIYYEITKSNVVIISKTFLTINPYKSPFNIQTAFADEGRLVCIYDKVHWGDGVIVVFDVTDPEGWFVGITPEEGRQSWIDRYDRLKQENPDMPDFFS
jgi:hypothetical protein